MLGLAVEQSSVSMHLPIEEIDLGTYHPEPHFALPDPQVPSLPQQ